MTEARSPIINAEQSKNMWKPSDIRPRLLVQIPYRNSITVKPVNKNKQKNTAKFQSAISYLINKSYRLQMFSKTNQI
jgi:hypothetical protein